MEPDVNDSGTDGANSRDVNEEEDDDPHELEQQPWRRLWSGRDLEMQCQQNSSIALVLAYLQIGAPDHDHGGQL